MYRKNHKKTPTSGVFIIVLETYQRAFTNLASFDFLLLAVFL